jgi:hypothetical protein
MNFPVFSQLAGNFQVSETGSLQTASSSGESGELRYRCFAKKRQGYSTDRPRPLAARLAVPLLDLSGATSGRKTIILRETVFSELGVGAARPITRAVGMAVILNPFAGQFVEDLSPLFEAGAMLGERLMPRPVEHRPH